jgi:hypothetical protein
MKLLVTYQFDSPDAPIIVEEMDPRVLGDFIITYARDLRQLTVVTLPRDVDETE